MKVKIFLPLYNVEKFINSTINSVLSQDFTDYEAYFLDDCSTDKTRGIIENFAKIDKRLKYVKNESQLFSLQNLFKNINHLTGEDDIIVVLDGDDFFASTDTLSKIVSKFRDDQCDFVYGDFIEIPKNLWVSCGEYDKDTIENKTFRKDAWRCTGIRAFTSKLWRKVKKEDLIDHRTNDFYRFAADQAYTYPMLENASNIGYCDFPIHIYNKYNPLNDEKIDSSNQIITESVVRNITLEDLRMIKNKKLTYKRITFYSHHSSKELK